MTMNFKPSQTAPRLAVRRGPQWLRGAAIVLLATGGFCLADGCGNASQPQSSAASSAAGSLAARGGKLYQADGCAGCHSLNGSRLTGPSWKGLADSRVELSDGKAVIADDAYLTRHIVEPNALTVQGYPSQVMAEAIGGLDLQHKPADVQALVAFIDSLR
jgi:mono/diheme cytochrome c family protein